MSASMIFSPSSTTRIRKTPCVLGCCGPMLTMNGSVWMVMAVWPHPLAPSPWNGEGGLRRLLGLGWRGPVGAGEYAVALFLLGEVGQARVLGAGRDLQKVLTQRVAG